MSRLVGLLAACITISAHAGWVRVDWSASPGVTALRSGCVAAGQYERPLIPIAGSSAGRVTIEGLPDTGRCYFSLNAGAQDEWVADFAALRFERAVPGAVRSLNVTWSPVPVALASVTLTRLNAMDEFNLVVTGAQSVRIAALRSAVFDWIKIGAAADGVGGTVVPTTPALGANQNDGTTAATVTLTGPVNGARVDFDGSAFSGASITVAGVTKPLVQSPANTWTVSFP